MPDEHLQPDDAAHEDTQPIPEPEFPNTPLHPRDIMLGRAVLTPLQVIETYSGDDWERFVEEWAHGAMNKRYTAVHRAPGAGDKGRDVIAYLEASPSTSPYDNYQCKHYSAPLAKGDIWVELGKLCWYTYRGVYRVPRLYHFVAPKGVGPELLQLIERPEAMRAGLLEHWDGSCARQIRRGPRIELDGEFREYVEQFDFSILRSLPPLELIEQHRTTRYYAVRFGGGLQRPRPAALQPPEEITDDEALYVRRLLEAYADSLQAAIPDTDALEQAHPRLRRHLGRQRVWFFKAASLRQFERDSLPNDAGFVDLMDQVYASVIDVHDREYDNGLLRLKATLDMAAQLHITRYVLRDVLDPADLRGVCHHLTNEREDFCWCESDDAA